MKYFGGLMVICVVVMLLAVPFVIFAQEKKSEQLTVYTTNYPLKYFTERIAGDQAKVVLPTPSDGDPAFWNPDTKAIAEFQKADLIFLNGATYEKWIQKVSLPQFRVVDTSAPFKDQLIHTEGGKTHSHGPGGEHSHAGTAFTTWIDFSQAAQQAKAIKDVLSRKKPDLKATFEKNYAALEKDLMAIDNKIQEIVSKKKDQPLVASHPVYQYFARRYGLNIRAVLWEPEEVPDEEQWKFLEGLLKEHPAKWMIWEGDPAGESVEKLKALGVDSTVFDPCGNVPDEGDFLAVMQQNVKNLEKVFD